MFFKARKRRNANRTKPAAAYAGIETLDNRILLSASNDDGGAAVANATGDTTANFAPAAPEVTVDDDNTLRIIGNGAHNDVTVFRDIQNGVVVIGVYSLTTNDQGEQTVSSFSVPQIEVESILFYGKSGADRFENQTNLPSYADGGFGNDTLIGGTGVDELVGGQGDDTLVGDSGTGFGGGNDTLRGGSGNDTLRGAGGHDHLYGSFGDDTLEGGPGNDWLYGDDVFLGIYSWWSGDDTLKGGLGNDHLYGLGGHDNLHGEGGDDYLSGGSGNDNLYGDNATDNLLAGEDTIYGGSGNDFLYGYRRDDDLYGGSGVDVIDGGRGNDYLSGGTGLDTLNGEAGNDVLDGGDDLVTDLLNGGEGQDIFILHYNLYGGNVFDTWQDYEAGIDSYFINFHLW